MLANWLPLCLILYISPLQRPNVSPRPLPPLLIATYRCLLKPPCPKPFPPVPTLPPPITPLPARAGLALGTSCVPLTVLGDDCGVTLGGRPLLGLALPQLGIIRVMFIVIGSTVDNGRQK